MPLHQEEMLGEKEDLGEGWTVALCCGQKYGRRKFRLMDAGPVGVTVVEGLLEAGINPA